MAAPRLDLGAISVGGEPVCYTLCGSHVTFVVRDFCQSAPLIPVGLLSGGLLLLRRPAASPGPGAHEEASAHRSSGLIMRPHVRTAQGTPYVAYRVPYQGKVAVPCNIME